MALFARVDEQGEVRLVNHLGVRLGDDPETMLDRLDRDAFGEADIDHPPDRVASAHDYAQDVRDVDADTPARFNADPKRLFEASGSAGKVMVFAVRLDTFPAESETKVFYIGTNDPAELTGIRRHILTRFAGLPIQGEYLHRAAFDIAARYGKDMFLAIRHLGTRWLPTLFAVKGAMDALAARLGFMPRHASDRIMQAISRLFPQHLPQRMLAFRERYEHHLMLKMAGPGIAEARRFLQSIFPSPHGAFFECTDDEGEQAFLHRFAAAGAAVRYRAVHHRDVEEIVAIDVALRRNDPDWFESLPDEVAKPIIHKLYYGHFFCHVFHQDYIVRNGHDPIALEHHMWAMLDARGAQYPAEHNVGHLYQAQPALIRHYKSLDPCNCFNPGIGRTCKASRWQGPA
jgi:D-lactate dehydrogenase